MTAPPLRSRLPPDDEDLPALHQSQTVEVDLFSDQPSDDYTVIVEDTNQVQGMPGNLQFFWAKSSGHNGDKLQVNITRSVAGTGRPSEIVFFVQKNGQSVSQWWGLVAGQ